MADPTPHTFPGSHALQLVTLLKRWDIEAQALLSGSGFSEAQLEDPRTRLSVDELNGLTRRARVLTGEPGIGFYLGVQKRLTMYGFLGFAAMSASRVREAIEFVVRFTPTVSTALRASARVEGTRVVLEFEELVDMGDVHDVALFSLLVGLRQLSEALTGVEPTTMSVDLPFEQPGYFPRFAHLLPNASFGRGAARVHFDEADLERKLVAPDRAAMRLAREACERELQSLGFDARVAPRVRRVMGDMQGVPQLPHVARSLHMSTRTLKRRLGEEGLSFTQLREEQLQSRALELLRHTNLSMEEVASRLDYASPGNFARAFRRWTGETPATYRRQQR